MRKLLIILGCIVCSCISATLEDDITNVGKFTISGVPIVVAGLAPISGTYTVHRQVDISNQLRKLEDDTWGISYSVSRVDDTLVITDTTFEPVSNIELSLTDLNNKTVVLISHHLLDIEKTGSTLSLHMDDNVLEFSKQALSAGVTTITLAITGTVSSNVTFPTSIINTLSTHVVIRSEKFFL